MLRTRAAAGVLALLVALAGCTGTSQPSPSTPTTSDPVTPTPQPDDEAALPGLPKGVTQKAVLGDPWSSRAGKVHGVARSALAIIKQTRKGQTLTLSMFNLTYPGTADALVRARRRGVAVRVLLNGEGARSREVRILTAGLGSDMTRTSYVVVRPGGVRMHSKFLLVTARGGAGPVVWVSSGNLTSASGRDQANEALITTGDQRLYDFLQRQFSLMRQGVTDPRRLSRSALTAGTFVRTYPLPKGGPAHDPILAVLNDVSCVHGNRRTVIRMAHLFLTAERRYVTARMRELVEQGCDLRVVARMGGWDRVVVTDLLRGGPGKVLLRAARGSDLHTKITTVDGWNTAGERMKIALVGSHNLTGRALTKTPEGVNDELSVRIWNPATVQTYERWVDMVIAKHSTAAKAA